MLNLKVIEQENGGLYVDENGKEMDVLSEITKQEFEKKFPEISTYGISWTDAQFLENGTILHEKEWNGENYFGDYGTYRPVYKKNGEDDFEIVGYVER